MDYKVFRAINQLSGRYSSLDMLMILISKKVRYIFMFVLIFMWFRNDSQKKIDIKCCHICGLYVIYSHVDDMLFILSLVHLLSAVSAYLFLQRWILHS
ncbi:hypothetical protein ACWA2C_32470 [Priestia megaterium]